MKRGRGYHIRREKAGKGGGSQDTFLTPAALAVGRKGIKNGSGGLIIMRITYNKREQRLAQNSQIPFPLHKIVYACVYACTHRVRCSLLTGINTGIGAGEKHDEEEINENKDVKGRDDKSEGAGGPEGTEEEETGGS